MGTSRAAAGKKRKGEELGNDNDDDVYYQNPSSAIVRTKRDAQINALRREFGDKLPQPFLRPKYKYVEWPTFLRGQKESPQPYINYDGKRKIIHRKFNCAHFDKRAGMIPAD